MITVNDTVGCEPFPKTGITEAKTAAGLSFIANATTMVPLLVVVGNSKIAVGSKVYVSGRDYVTPWAKAVYKTADKEIIFVPQTAVLMVEPK